MELRLEWGVVCRRDCMVVATTFAVNKTVAAKKFR